MAQMTYTQRQVWLKQVRAKPHRKLKGSYHREDIHTGSDRRLRRLVPQNDMMPSPQVLYHGGRKHYKTIKESGGEVWASRDPKVAEHFALGGKNFGKHQYEGDAGYGASHHRGFVHTVDPKGFGHDAPTWEYEQGYVKHSNVKPLGGYWVKEHRNGRITRHVRKPFVYSEDIKPHHGQIGVAVGVAAVAGGGYYAYRHREEIKAGAHRAGRRMHNIEDRARLFHQSRSAHAAPYYQRRLKSGKTIKVRNGRRK